MLQFRCWKLDRLGRRLGHLVNTVQGQSARGVGLRVLTECRGVPPSPPLQIPCDGHAFGGRASRVVRDHKGAKANWQGGHKASTLWEIDHPRKSETGHSAQKPVECMQRAIHNHRGDVYDPFVGSGTTVIAGEQEGRSVYTLEIEPAYVDVTVRRWEDFTGQKAIQVTTP